LRKASSLVDVRHCVGNSAIEGPSGFVWLAASTFAYEPYAISSSSFLLDVVRCVGYAMEYSCETWTESHYYRGELSFSIRLLDGVDASLASRIVDATMNRPCGPRVPESGGRIS